MSVYSPYLFLSIFFSLYFLMHLYLYLRLPKRNPLLKLCLLLLFVSPLFMRLSDKYLSPEVTFLISFLALFWMGFLLYFIVVDLVLRLWLRRPYLSLLIALLLSLYSYWETLSPEVHYITIFSPKIPSNQSLKILHISDVHLGPLMGLDKVLLIKRAQQRYNPDLILSTGDFVDGNMKNRAYLKDALREIEAPLGKYAVVGNHEYYRGIEHSITFTEEAGFKVLRGETAVITPYLTLVGLDDDDCRHFGKCRYPLKETELLGSLSQEKFLLLLKHKPRLDSDALGRFDLMLSGHTHGGLYYPIGRWLLKRFFNFEYPGFQALSPRGYLFVSKGVGTGGPPMRFFCPPDLAIIELRGGPESYHLFRPVPLNQP